VDRLRVALIGPGFIAQRHLEVLSTEPGVELVGIQARTEATAAAAAARFGGRPYSELDRMLDTERPDVAWVCITPDQHGPLERSLIERGIHLFTEKPLAADAETPERIGAALAASGLVAGVAYHWRAMDTIAEVADVIASRPVKLLNGHWHDELPGVDWWRDLATGGGQMVEQATHLVDLSRRLLGEGTVIASIADSHVHPRHPEMDVPDVSTAAVRYDGGALGVFTATCILGGTSAQEIRLFADDLAITVRQQGVLYEDARVKAVTATDGFTGSRKWGVTGTRYVPTGNDPFRTEDRAFLDAVRHGDPSRVICTYDDALRTHRLTTAIRTMAEQASGAG
jgi:myo-inositol 2-dehydrogenase/D-chiro-inositol 1-dehydrogenase